MSKTVVSPVGQKDRIGELDVLRGVALFGVLTMNFVAFAGPGFGMTEAQAAVLPTETLDYYAHWGVRWLIGDKANTVFATLFGLGFYLQMQRGEGKPGFEARYRRRLFWLLVFGILNTIFLWAWDILNLYAIAGFILLAMRRWSTRTLVVFGIVAALYSPWLQEWLIDALALPVPNSEAFSTSAGILERQAVLISGDYAALVGYFWHYTLIDWLLAGGMVAYLIYALGRFALGAAIGRSGILSNLPRFLPLLRRIAWVTIPIGLIIGAVIRLMYTGEFGDDETVATIGRVLRSPAALILAAGYCAGIVVALQKPWGKRLFAPFAPVGQMALTNYLAQGLIYGFVMSGIGPGLALAGKIGSFSVLLICIAFFAFQTAFSHWWLARYRFGPMEWLWRALTYGERPSFRRSEDVAAAVA
ncbi:MAG TPA: DUF418 domain-containing protein [Sphingomicrobium sp.]|nr:DUF418 domain-containing protein [Sphingomicrobium sp.]